MRAMIVTRRSERVVEVSTSEHCGRQQVTLRPMWINDEGVVRSSGTPLWIPAGCLDELIAALSAAREEVSAGGTR